MISKILRKIFFYLNKLFSLRQRINKFSFNQILCLSLGLHLSLILFFGLKHLVFKSNFLKFEQAIRVDIVSLPDKYEGRKRKQIYKPKASKKANKKLNKKVNKKIIKKQKNSLEKLESLNSKDKDESKKKEQFKGNILNEGSALSGLEKIQFDSYYAKVKSHIYTYWEVPAWLASKSLATKVIVKIQDSGQVSSMKISSFSGNKIFDESALKAIEKSSPLPEVPKRLRSLFKSKELELGFR